MHVFDDDDEELGNGTEVGARGKQWANMQTLPIVNSTSTSTLNKISSTNQALLWSLLALMVLLCCLFAVRYCSRTRTIQQSASASKFTSKRGPKGGLSFVDAGSEHGGGYFPQHVDGASDAGMYRANDGLAGTRPLSINGAVAAQEFVAMTNMLSSNHPSPTRRVSG
jgi:hypothetical protein